MATQRTTNEKGSFRETSHLLVGYAVRIGGYLLAFRDIFFILKRQ
jgi:hypothetical protein